MRKIAVATLLVLSSTAAHADGHKVLYVNAYHQGYPWSDGIQAALTHKLEAAGVEVKVFLMDTKNNPAAAPQKAQQVHEMITRDKPDVVIVSDDNPVKMVVTPYLKNGATPVVFCGVNWDGNAHGLPYSNTTGMYEVALVQPLVEMLKRHAKGARVGLLASDNETSRADGAGMRKYGGQAGLVETYVKDLAAWKAAFVELQSKVDILLIRNDGIKEWNDAQMAGWVDQNTKIPTGAVQEEVAPFALATFAKLPSEQGEFAAEATLKILGGAKPADITPARNKKAKVVLNPKIAKQLNITFSPEELKNAKLLK